MLESTDFIALGALGTIKDLLRLPAHLAPRSSVRSADAVRAAADILRRATPEDIAWLGRQRAFGSDDYAWSSLLPSDLGAPPLHPDSTSAPIAALASMHWSGYVREAAVRLLATRRDGAELPFLLLRVNDWVPEVRAAAMEAVRARLESSYSNHFVGCLGLVDGLRGLRRNQLSGLVDEVEALVAKSDVRLQEAQPASMGSQAAPNTGAHHALLAALGSPSKAARRAAARVAVRCGDPVLVLGAVTSKDPVVASLGARFISASWSEGALREVLPALRRGGPELRWIALAAVCDRLPGEAEPHLRAALLDPSTSLRELARHRWEKVGLPPLDFVAFYRQALSAAEGPSGPAAQARTQAALPSARRALAVALRGLAETTTGAGEGALFEAHLHHASAPVRSAAVLGLGRSADPRYTDALASAMDDPSTRVAAEARRWVRLRLGRAAVRFRPRRGD